MPVKPSQFASFTPQDILDGKISAQEYESGIKPYLQDYLDHYGLELLDDEHHALSADELFYHDLESFREILHKSLAANLGVNRYGEHLVTHSSAPGLFGTSVNYTARLRPINPDTAEAITALKDSFDDFYSQALGVINHRLLRDVRMDDPTLPTPLPRFIMNLFEIYVQDRVLLGDRSTGVKHDRTSSVAYQRSGEIPVSAALAEYCGIRDSSRLVRMTGEILDRFDSCFDAARMPDGRFVSTIESDFAGLITQLQGNPDLKIDLYRPLDTITDGVKIFVRSLVGQSPDLMQNLAEIDRQTGITQEILRQKDLITGELQKIESISTPQELYRTLIRPFEGDQTSRTFLYGKLGIAENDLNTIYEELDFLFGAESVLRNSADEIRDKLAPLRDKNFKHLGEKRWQFLTDLAIAKKHETAKQSGRQVMLIGGSIAAGIVAGALSGGNPVIGTAAGMGVAAFMGGIDVMEVQKRLETIRGVNTVHRLTRFELGSEDALKLVEMERDYALSSALCNTLLAGVSGGASAAVGKRLSGQAIRLALAQRVAAEAGIGAGDGLISALTDGRITDVAFLENTAHLSTGSADEAPSVMEGIMFSVTVSALFGAGTEAGMASAGKTFRCIRDHLGRTRWLRADGKEIAPDLKITGRVNGSTGRVEYEWSDGRSMSQQEIDTLDQMARSLPTITRDFGSAKKNALELTRLSGKEHTIFRNPRGDYFVQEGSAKEAWSDALDADWTEGTRDQHREFFGTPVAHTHPPGGRSMPSYGDLLQFAASAKLTLKDGESFTTRILTPREGGDITVTLLVRNENGHIRITAPQESNPDLGQSNGQVLNAMAWRAEHQINSSRDERQLKEWAGGRLSMADEQREMVFEAAHIAEKTGYRTEATQLLDATDTTEDISQQSLTLMYDILFVKHLGFNEFELSLLLKFHQPEDILTALGEINLRDKSASVKTLSDRFFGGSRITSARDYFSKACALKGKVDLSGLGGIRMETLSLNQMEFILARIDAATDSSQIVGFLRQITAQKLDARIRKLVLTENTPTDTAAFLFGLGATDKKLSAPESPQMIQRTRDGLAALVQAFAKNGSDFPGLEGRIFVADWIMSLFNPTYNKGIVREVRSSTGQIQYKPMKLVSMPNRPAGEQGTPGLHQEFQSLVPEIINHWREIVFYTPHSDFNPDLITASSLVECKTRFHTMRDRSEHSDLFKQLPLYLDWATRVEPQPEIRYILMSGNPKDMKRALQEDIQTLMQQITVVRNSLTDYLAQEKITSGRTWSQDDLNLALKDWLKKIKIEFRSVDQPTLSTETMSLSQWLNRNLYNLKNSLEYSGYRDLLTDLGLANGIL